MASLFKSRRAASCARFLLLLLVYTTVLVSALWVAYLLRFDFKIPEEFWPTVPLIGWVVGIKLALLFVFGQHVGLLTYFSVPDLRRIFLALALASIAIGLVRVTEGVDVAPPRGVILLDFVLSFLAVAGVRLGFRLWRERSAVPAALATPSARRVGIIGAGDAGASLARELLAKRGLGLKPVVLFDDDSSKWNSRVHGIPVVGPIEAVTRGKRDFEIDEAIIAMPSAPAWRINEVVQLLRDQAIPFETVPSLDQLATGQIRVSQLRSVEIEDLLGREMVSLEVEQITTLIRGRTLLVTGAGGSIGSELSRQIAGYQPTRIVLVEQSEAQMFLIEQELVDLGHGNIVVPVVADVTDRRRLASVFQAYKPEVIFHAAAHKHVPLMESQPAEAIRNNVLGTVAVAELAVEYGAERFVLISTDKAINPSSTMGASKRLAEIFLQSFYGENPGATKLMAVRFGNVLNSSGSVIPTFKKQIAAGGPVKVTHPEVSRYFMTISEAVGLVLQSATQGDGGEIFVLDMGEPIKIIDLARQMIELSGFRPEEDIAIEFVGLRPGEKMFEELSYNSENMDRTHHSKVMRLKSEAASLSRVRKLMDQIESQLHTAQPDELKLLLKTAVPEYQPFFEKAQPKETPQVAEDSPPVLASRDL